MKFIYLESIRGLAALVVVCNHLGLAFCGLQESDVLTFAGAFAVRLFFFLSGFVLSVSYFQRRNRLALASAALRRYPRLMLPACASVMVVWTLMEWGLLRNQAAAIAMQQSTDSWLNTELTVKLTGAQALIQGVFGTFFHYDGDATLNSSLWTMWIELAGSYFVFLFLALRYLIRPHYLLYIIIVVLLAFFSRRTICMYLLDFLAGIALCEVFIFLTRANPNFRIRGILALPLAGIGFVTGVWATTLCVKNPPWAFFGPAELTTLSSSAVVGAAVFSARMQSALEHPVITFLGRVSFPLYLFHLAVINSVGCAAYVGLRESGLSHVPSAIAVCALCLVVSLLVAWICYYLVELPAIRASSAFARFCIPSTTSENRKLPL